MRHYVQALANHLPLSSSKMRRRTHPIKLQFESIESRILLTSVSGDFNGDGIADLAIGIPNQTVNGIQNAGAVQILYGTSPSHGIPTGLSTIKQQLFNSGNIGVPNSHPPAEASFGASLAVGDFNHDGISDLAVGATGQSVGSAADAGAVFFIYGSHAALKQTGAVEITENSANIAGVAAAEDHFGATLATGDFNGDHFIDIAVGAPNKTVGSFTAAGTVNVIYGGPFGLTTCAINSGTNRN